MCYLKPGVNSFEVIKRFLMEIQNESTPPSTSNQLRNVNTVCLESMNVTTQPEEIDNRKSEVIAFVINSM